MRGGRRAALVVPLALALAACLGQVGPSGSGGPPEGNPTPVPTASPFSPEALADTLPDRVGGVIFQKFSMSGEEFLAGSADEQFVAFLDRVGASRDDVAVAAAIGADLAGTNQASIFAFQVVGVDASTLVDEFQGGADGGTPAMTWHTSTISGKPVQVSNTTDDFPVPVILYPSGNVMYFISSTDPNVLATILSDLP